MEITRCKNPDCNKVYVPKLKDTFGRINPKPSPFCNHACYVHWYYSTVKPDYRREYHEKHRVK